LLWRSPVPLSRPVKYFKYLHVHPTSDVTFQRHHVASQRRKEHWADIAMTPSCKRKGTLEEGGRVDYMVYLFDKRVQLHRAIQWVTESPGPLDQDSLYAFLDEDLQTHHTSHQWWVHLRGGFDRVSGRQNQALENQRRADHGTSSSPQRRVLAKAKARANKKKAAPKKKPVKKATAKK
jgi:hypothetical protein